MCNIYVKQPVTQVVLNTTDITVRKGQVFWLNATCLPENADNKSLHGKAVMKMCVQWKATVR